LKLNKPSNESETDALKRMIIEFEMGDDVREGNYGIRGTCGQRLLFGPGDTLLVRRNEMVAYLLALLDGLKDEMNSAEQYDEAWCAA
jgi:hypothetical protein